MAVVWLAVWCTPVARPQRHNGQLSSEGSGRRSAASQSATSLLLPAATAYDSAGNLFFADARRHQVFELTLAGVWSVVAGTGEQGASGDGGPATAALLNGPRGLAVSPDGTLYIADTGNQRIRAVANGVISTVAGSGVRGFSDGAALQAALRDPAALAVDTTGRLVVCDTGNHRIRRLTSGQLITIAGDGVQGFSSDGGPGTEAELDTPLGVAVSSAGTIYVADTHNQRVRALSSDGTISTLAGTGAKGFSGDGGSAVFAQLSQPFGVAVGSDGSVLIADAGNQRIRSVSTNGVITTIAGSGVQGVSTDSTQGTAAALDSPRSVSVQRQGQPVFAESHNASVRELASDNALYTLALLAAPRTSTVTAAVAPTVVYGQGSFNVRVEGGAATPQGSVSLVENGSLVGSASLTAGSATFSLGALAVGSHVLSAAYAGDGLNGSASSSTSSVSVSAAPAVATANAATMVYGASLPAFTGALSGILPRDAGTVHAVFSAAVGVLSPVGSYPITAALAGQGSANYTLGLGATSGSLVISQAESVTTLVPPTQAYAGLPMLLSANVASATSGVPTGSVDFLDGGATISSAAIVNGTASTSILSASAGSHTYAARYRGDTNFLVSTSAMTNVVVGAIPDFNVTVASSNESVQGGSVAVFTVNVAPQNGPFTGAVSFSVSGLPQRAVATFSPASVVPGASTASVSLSIQTVAVSGRLHGEERRTVAFALVLLPLASVFAFRPRRRWPMACVVLAMVSSCASFGCGARTTAATTVPSQTYTLTVRGTGTNLAGAAVSHSGTANLTVF